MKLTDLEICKRIAEIEGVKGLVESHTTQTLVYENSLGICSETRQYNPLQDDALCFQLMVKHKVDVGFENSGFWCAWYFRGGVMVFDIVSDKNPNKAICLAIIEANKDK